MEASFRLNSSYGTDTHLDRLGELKVAELVEASFRLDSSHGTDSHLNRCYAKPVEVLGELKVAEPIEVLGEL